MKMRTKIKLFVAILFIQGVFISCFKAEDYPIEPVIADAEVATQGDTLAIITFSFTDGDADLGLNPGDTLGEFEWPNYYYYNIYLTPFEKDDALGWVQKKDLNGDPFEWPYRIKPISISENTKGIKGTIDIEVDNYQAPNNSNSDTMKFEIKIIDRAKHESNIISTPDIISG